jgi:uncharacterized membrane protein YeaQ/YmgE (transglycosylase-associated protein family)
VAGTGDAPHIALYPFKLPSLANRTEAYGVTPEQRGGCVEVLTWIIVGLIAGLLASLVMGGVGYGILGDIVLGILGALIGGWLFAQMGWGTPFSGLAGAIFVAFIGAIVLLVIIRLLRGARRTP